jgi:drug/metabolite transporter (DMT)-like permease
LRSSDLGELLLLAALWGASFLFMRMGAAEFGPIALVAVRVSGAALFLLPLLHARGQISVLRRHWRPIFLVGLTNSALPFLCFGYAALSISAGLSAIFNAASPLFGALVAWLWLKDRLSAARVVGLVIGFGGVLWLAWNKADHAAAFKPGGSGWAIVACLGGAVLYGISASLTKKTLAGVAPMAVAAGSQLSAALALALPALLWWPGAMPSGAAWLTAAALAIFCTGVAYVLYFRLIANIGPANAISVTFLVPAFAVLWGGVLLGERPTAAMGIGCAVILFGTSLATGLLKVPAVRRAR